METIKTICPKCHSEYNASVMVDDFLGLGRLESCCPKCQPEYDAQFKAEVEAEKGEAIIERWPSMGIPPMYYDATLDNFDPYSPNLKSALSATRKLVSGEYSSLVFVGGNGAGKTHLGIGALKQIGGAIYKMYGISCMIRATYTAKATETEQELLDRLARLPLLVIDEMGRTKGSDSELAWLSYIIDSSHANGNKLILISNNHARSDCPSHGCDKCLENYLGDDSISRLMEHGAVVKFKAEDYRRKKS